MENIEQKEAFQVVGTTVYQLEFDRWRKGVAQQRNRVYATVQGYRDTPKEELEATARMFAAAPEMLEALQAIVRAGNFDNYLGDDVQQMIDYGQAMEDIKKAIAKALGKP